MIRKSISLTELHEKWLKEESKRLGISESDIIRRLIDMFVEKIEKERKQK